MLPPTKRSRVKNAIGRKVRLSWVREQASRKPPTHLPATISDVKENELVAFAILGVLLVLYIAWPRAVERGLRRRGPEGPAHPYRRAAARNDGSARDDSPHDKLGWAPPEEEVIPSRLVEHACRTGRRWEAIAFLESEIAHSPDPDLAYLLARTLAEHGDQPGAERWLLAAARFGQRDLERARGDIAFAALRDRPGWPKIEAALAGD